MSVWTRVTITVTKPKDQNISDIVSKVLDRYKYSETFFKSFYSKEKGVIINFSSTLNIKFILPLLLDIEKEIKTYSYFEINTFL